MFNIYTLLQRITARCVRAANEAANEDWIVEYISTIYIRIVEYISTYIKLITIFDFSAIFYYRLNIQILFLK